MASAAALEEVPVSIKTEAEATAVVEKPCDVVEDKPVIPAPQDDAKALANSAMEQHSMTAKLNRLQQQLNIPNRPPRPTSTNAPPVEGPVSSGLRSKRSRASSSSTVPVVEEVEVQATNFAPPIPTEPSVLFNDPPGSCTSYFNAAVCQRDLEYYMNSPLGIRERAYHTSLIQNATLFESISRENRRNMDQITLLKQNNHQLEEQMSQLRLSFEEERKNANKKLEEEVHRAGKKAVRAFRKSEAGKLWVEDRSAEWCTKGFSRCHHQFMESGMFSPDIDLSFLELSREMPKEFTLPPFNPGPFSSDEETEE